MTNTIRKKLFLSILALSLIPILIISSILIYQSNSSLETMIEEDVQQTRTSIDEYFHLLKQDALSLANSFSQASELTDAIKSKDKAQLDSLMNNTYTLLNKEKGISVFEFGDESGVVITRLHNQEKFGDDKGDNPGIQAALKGNEVTGLEFGSSGLAVRAFVPIKDGQNVVGTLQLGFNINEDMLQQVESLTGAQLAFYEQNQLIQTNIQSLQQQLDEELYQSILQSEEISQTQDHQLMLYSPLYNLSGDEVYGVIQIAKDLSIINETKRSMVSDVIVTGILTLAGVIIITFFTSRYLLQPIHTLTGKLQELANGTGDLTFRLHTKGRDEISKLSNEFNKMMENMQSIMKDVQSSTNVTLQSSQKFAHLTNDMVQQSQQFEQNLVEIAERSSMQLEQLNQGAFALNELASGIQQVAEHSFLVSDTSQNTAQKADHGLLSMKNAMNQLHHMANNVNDTSDTMKKLKEESKQITKVISVIQDIADQTNLLALNASIEAARVGEHGKGFAVVADEVRKLAEETTKSTSEISSIIDSIHLYVDESIDSVQKAVEEVRSGVQLFEQVQSSFTEILQSTKDVASHIEEVSATGQHMSASTEEVTASINDVKEAIAKTDELLQKAVQMSAEHMEAAKTISSISDSQRASSEALTKSVSQFKIE